MKATGLYLLPVLGALLSQAASAEDYIVEAESMSPFGGAEVVDDADASGGAHVLIPEAGGLEFLTPGEPNLEYQLAVYYRADRDTTFTVATMSEQFDVSVPATDTFTPVFVPEVSIGGGEYVVITGQDTVICDYCQIIEECDGCKISDPDRDSNIVPHTNEWLLPGLSILTSFDVFIHSSTTEVPVQFDVPSQNIFAQRNGICGAPPACPTIKGCSGEFSMRCRRLITAVNWFNVATGNSASQSGHPDRELEEDFFKRLRAKAEGEGCPSTLIATIKIFQSTYTITWTCGDC